MSFWPQSTTVSRVSEQPQTRIFRIYRPSLGSDIRMVQYGYWHRSQTGVSSRFAVLREWPAKDLAEAESLQAKLRFDILLDPKLMPPPDAVPQEHSFSRKKKLASAPPDVRRVLHRAVTGLTDPLPSIEDSCKKMGVIPPKAFRDGAHFDCYLNGAILRQLMAMAAAAGVSRNRMIEALILSAEDAASASGHDD